MQRKQKPVLTIKKQHFSKSKKSHFFSKGLNHTFGQKMPIFSLFKFDQNKPRNSAV